MSSTTPQNGNKRPREAAQLDVIVVACGEPKKSMGVLPRVQAPAPVPTFSNGSVAKRLPPVLCVGWFHLTQLLDSPNASINFVVEPWFLGGGRGKPGSEAFEALRAANPDVQFCASVLDVPDAAPDALRAFLIAGRTCDAPRLFAEALTRGATHVYIEKPGGWATLGGPCC